MEIDTHKIDEAVLGLLYLTLHDGCRAWKGADWDALARLYQKGLIDNPATKTKSVVFTEDGLREAERSFEKQFTKQTPSTWKICPVAPTPKFVQLTVLPDSYVKIRSIESHSSVFTNRTARSQTMRYATTIWRLRSPTRHSHRSTN